MSGKNLELNNFWVLKMINDMSFFDNIENENVCKAILKANSVIRPYKKIMVSISGGSDSDILVDLMEKVRDESQKIDYVFFDTGIEYYATKKHLNYLENRYNIKIQRIKSSKSIPMSCKQYGQPFISKFVSTEIYSLQLNGFKFEDKPYEKLIEEYPKCKSRIMWWCDMYSPQLSIRNFKYLKEFLIANPPTFKISAKCCEYSKKALAKNILKKNKYELDVTGIRKSEGGVRSYKYKTCFSEKSNDYIATFMPLFWFNNDDKKYYNEFFKIQNSDCYTKYALKRTGCACCPFSRSLEQELDMAEQFEPKIANACKTIFKESYDYTQKYKKFKEEMRKCKK